MITVDRLFAEYIAEHQSGGEADPRAFLGRARPADRVELGALLDAYLARAPRRAPTAAAFAGSAAERTVDELERALGGRSGLWPAVLPALRARAGMRRSDLVQRLAAALGVGDRTAKVADYYHQMEQGRLAASGVSTRVLTVLGGLIGESAEALREAGEALSPPPQPTVSHAVFARLAAVDGDAGVVAAAAPAAAPEQDEVDRLFTAGDV